MRTIFAVIAVFSMLSADGPAHAGSGGVGELHFVFAGCAGRHSAQMEHAFLMGEDASRHMARRASFISLFEASVPKAAARQAFGHRVASKMAQAALLTAASFNDDAGRATWARAAAARELATCERLLLES